MTSIKHLVFGLALAASAGWAQIAAAQGTVAPVQPETPPNWTTPTLETCLNLPAEDLRRSPACHTLLHFQNMSVEERETLARCIQKGDARTEDAACQAVWQKYPNVVKLRRA